MSSSASRTACPSCREKGEDSLGNHLKVFEDGRAGWCFKEHKVIHLEGAGGERLSRRSNVTKDRDASQQIALVATFPTQAYPQRNISLETMEFFGVKTEVSQEDASPFAHWYPYYAEDGTVQGVKCRVLPKDFSRGVYGKLKSFFGWNKVQGSNFIIVVEGEADCLAARDMMIQLKGKAYNVVSLPNGANEAGTVDAVTRGLLEGLARFSKVVLMLDNDTNGKAISNSIADYLCSSTDVRIAELPLKDTAAMWEAGRADEWMKCISSSKPYVSDQIVLGSDIELVSLMEPLVQGVNFSFIPKTCAKLHGFRTREMTTIIAPPKCGKSSFLRQAMYEILRDTDESVGGFFLEETVTKTKQSVIAMHCGLPLNLFRAKPHLADKHKVQEAYDTMLPRLHLFTHKRKQITDDLLERKIDYLVRTLGCQTVIVDHTTFVIGTRQSANERQDIDQMLTRLARSVEDENYRLFVVAHIKRGAREQSRTDSKVKYPYWEILSPDDARGSGSYEQLSHNMIGIERQRLDPEETNTRGLVRTRILLSREWGVEGIGDYLSFGEDGKFTPIESEY